MSAVAEVVRQAMETPQEAARRLSAHRLAKGYKPTALHVYRDAEGKPVYWRIRLKHPDGDKWMRPMHRTADGFAIGESPAPATGKLLYRLPELLAADPAAPALIVEGESCADALAGLGLAATTSGSCSSADAADWTPCKGRSCTIWPDNDLPGTKYAEAVTAKLRALGCRVSWVDVAGLGLADKGDCVDWLQAHPEATAADVLTLTTIQPPEAAAPQAPAPEPLRRPVPPPDAYPIDELGPILAPACKALRRVIQAPEAVCGASLLAAASLAVQGLVDVVIDGRPVPLSLWFLTIAESGERKSAVDAEAMRTAREIEREWAQAYEADLKRFTAEMAEYKLRQELATTDAKKAKGEGLADRIEALGDAPEPPLLPLLTCGDFTAEGVYKLLRDGRPSLGAFTDEGGIVFGGHAMTKETETRTAATLSKLWDNGTLDRVRGGDGAGKLWGKRLALHLMVQPVIAERALSNEVLAGQGFLARCLLAWPEGTAGTRHYVAESVADDPAVKAYGARIGALLGLMELPLAEGTRNELAPGRLTLTREAKAVWIALHDTIDAAEEPNGRYESCKAWASKAADNVLRVAGVLTLIENEHAQTIAEPTLRSAAELVLWHMGEAARLAGMAETSAETRDAEAILEWCHKDGIKHLHSGRALQFGPNRIRERERFMIAMGCLEEAGWAARIDGSMDLDGKRRRNVWRIAGGEA